MAGKPQVVHIIGGGIAGLAAAAQLACNGAKVHVYEAAPQAGGRCRSYFDKTLGMEIDNGNHLLLGCNKAALQLIRLVGTEGKFNKISRLPFVDVHTGEQWRFPGWNMFRRRFLRHLAVSILNTPPEIAFRALFRKVMWEILRSGRQGRTAWVPKHSWQDALVTPLVDYITARGGEVGLSCRVKSLELHEGRVTLLRLEHCAVEVGEADNVILAVPPFAAAELLPGLVIPTEHMPIVNVHFGLGIDYSRVGLLANTMSLSASRTEADSPTGSLPPVIGILGGTAEWVFFREGIVSTTTSAAVKLVEEADEVIAAKIWRDIQYMLEPSPRGRGQGEGVTGEVAPSPGASRHPLSLGEGIPPYRVIKEKRATFACTPDNLRKRPGVETDIRNLFLAGDYTDTGLPATIEGAVRSGVQAAKTCGKL